MYLVYVHFMGLWPKLLEDMCELKRAGFVNRGGRIAEIGQQQLTDQFLHADKLLAEVYQLFEAPRIRLGTPVGADNFTEHAPLARPFWQSLGFEYVAIDLVGDNIIKLDLNRDAVPLQLQHTQDIVLNGGTTEHVANQDNAFRCIHDLTKPGDHDPCGAVPRIDDARPGELHVEILLAPMQRK